MDFQRCREFKKVGMCGFSPPTRLSINLIRYKNIQLRPNILRPVNVFKNDWQDCSKEGEKAEDRKKWKAGIRGYRGHDRQPHLQLSLRPLMMVMMMVIVMIDGDDR